jgi:hypothetical protein
VSAAAEFCRFLELKGVRNRPDRDSAGKLNVFYFLVWQQSFLGEQSIEATFKSEVSMTENVTGKAAGGVSRLAEPPAENYSDGPQEFESSEPQDEREDAIRIAKTILYCFNNYALISEICSILGWNLKRLNRALDVCLKKGSVNVLSFGEHRSVKIEGQQLLDMLLYSNYSG